MQRRLAAILAADVVGYSRLIRADEEGTLAAFSALRAEIIDPMIADHHGRVFKLMGDGVLAEFASVVDAVRAAAGLQQAVAECNGALPQDKRIQFRVGINLGDVVIDGDDIHGDGVNVAARLEGLAEPGGIYVSAAVYDQVRDRIDFPFEDLGDHQVKNIDRPVRVWRWVRDIAVPSPGITGGNELRTLPDKPSIVVLPFDNMSGDPEQEYFSDGITEDIITDLSKASGLFVIARNSAFVYKDKASDIPDICSKLGVRFAVEGSVRKAGNRVRITAQLIDGATGGHLWAERYDRDLTDIFAVQDDVTQQIVGALKVTLSDSERSLIVGAGTANVAAHDLFLKGRAIILGSARDRQAFDQSTALFRRAVGLDPNYGAPYAGLGLAYMLDHQNHWSDAPATSLDKADDYVRQAIAKDDTDSFAFYVSALVGMWQKDYARWADDADRALAINPNFALALNARGIVNIYTGEPDEAIPYIERAMRLDPVVPHGQYTHFLGTAYFVAGDYATATEIFRDRVALNPKTDLSRAFLAAALGHLGELDEARRIWRELQEINPEYSPTAHLARLPFRDPADAAKFADGLRQAGLLE